MKSLSLKFRNHLVHLHGRYVSGDIKKLSALGTTIQGIASGINPVVKEQLTDLLNEHSALVFVGYSGSDYFDVNPFFAELALSGIALKPLVVYWLNHVPIKPHAEITPYSQKRKKGFRKTILESLCKCGAEVLVADVHTTVFLMQTSDAWKVPAHVYKDISKITPPRAKPKLVVNDNLRLLATGNLYRLMGIGKEVVALSDQLLATVERLPFRERNRTGSHSRFCLQNQIYYTVFEGYREAGFYKRSNKLLSRFIRTNLLDYIFWLQKMAGGYWLMGSVIRSWIWFRRALAVGRRAASVDDICRTSLREIQFEIDMRYLHWYGDIMGIPILRNILPHGTALKAFRRVCDEEDLIRALPYDQAHLRRLYEHIPFLKYHSKLPDCLSFPVEALDTVFAETDNVLGVINYTRLTFRAFFCGFWDSFWFRGLAVGSNGGGTSMFAVVIPGTSMPYPVFAVA